MRYVYSVLIIFLFTINTYSQKDTILIDFGNDLSEYPWNNLTLPRTGSLTDMINTKGFATGIGISVTDAFNGINNTGTTTADPQLDIPTTASGDSFFGNTVEFSGTTEPTGAITLDKLDTDRFYTIDIFSSRVASDNRDTKYIIEGKESQSLILGVSSNENTIVSMTMMPDDNGHITITASPGDNNNNTNGFYYLGVIKLSYDSVEIGEPELSLVSPQGEEYWQIGKAVEIEWLSQNLSRAFIEYSIDRGNNWITIDTVPAVLNSYNWTVPDTPSSDCLVRVSSDTLSVMSDDVFEIASDDSECTIAILGSSTAAGTGPSSSDSTWVNRYRRHLYQEDTRYNVVNLAMGGTTTYNILPTDTDIDPSIGMTIDTLRNVTRALTFDPYAIIINMPSNDAANFFSAEDQLRNFDTIIELAQSQEIKVWVCTTQPRNFGDSARIEIQEEARDSILARYGDFAIDFWTDFATADGRISPEYDSGDGVHFNDAAHRILQDKIQQSRIDTFCNRVVISSNTEVVTSDAIEVYPNPFDDILNVKFMSLSSSQISMEVLDLQGRLVAQRNYSVVADQETITWRVPELESLTASIFVLKISVDGNNDFYSQLIYRN